MKMNTRRIVNSGIVLSLLIVAKLLEAVLPDLPSGLGEYIPLFDLFIILSIFLFSKWDVLISTLIYLLLIVWISPPIFIGGILWVEKLSTKIFVYVLDYLIPTLIILSPSFFITKYKGFWKSFLIVLLAIFAMYVSHVFSGLLFWSSYAWNGWMPFTYSVVANGPKLLIMIFLSTPIIKIGISLRNAIVKESVYGY